MKNLAKLFLVLISFSGFSQSPWTQEKGKFYTQLSFTTIPKYNTLFGSPEHNINGNITDNTIQFYSEFGITNKTSLILNLPYKSITFNQDVVCVNGPCSSINDKENSLGNVSFGIKHNFYKKDWLFSGQLTMEINSGSYNATSGIRTGYDALTFTPLFIAGKSFGKTYLQTFVGVDIRTNNYSSNIKVGGEIGKKLGTKFWLIGFIDVSKSVENGDIVLPQENIHTGLYVNNQEYGAFGFKSIYEINSKFGINAGFGGAFFGNNVAKAPALTIGLYHKF